MLKLLQVTFRFDSAQCLSIFLKFFFALVGVLVISLTNVPASILPALNKLEDAACVSYIDETEDLSSNVFLLLDLSELKLKSLIGLPLLRFVTSKINNIFLNINYVC